MAVATTDVGSFAFLFHDGCTEHRLRDGIDQLRAALRQTLEAWDPFSADPALQVEYLQAKGDRLRDLLHAAEKKEEGEALKAYRPYGLTDAYVAQQKQDLEAAKTAVASALRIKEVVGIRQVNFLRHQKALAEARTVWAEAAERFDRLLQSEIKLAALRLQTANQAYCNNAKAFEEHVLKLTAADDELQALQATTFTAAASSSSGSSLGRPSTPMARCIQVVEETDDDDDETGLEAYGGAGPNSRKR